MRERGERTMGTAATLARGGAVDRATEAFVAHRNLLFTVAYEMLGSAAARSPTPAPGCPSRC